MVHATEAEILHAGSIVLLWTLGWGVLMLASMRTAPAAMTKASDVTYWGSSVMSSVHAIGMVAVALQVLASGVNLEGDFDRRDATWEAAILASIGYFVFDGILTAVTPTIPGGQLMLFHHVLSVLTHFYPVIVCHYGLPISLIGYMAELSTPFVNARWMLKEAGGGSGTTAYMINGVLMAVVFFGCRIVNCGYMLYMIYVAHPAATGGDSLGAGLGGGVFGNAIAPLATVFYVLNLYWMAKIGKGIVAVLTPGKKKKAA